LKIEETNVVIFRQDQGRLNSPPFNGQGACSGPLSVFELLLHAVTRRKSKIN
jgi:hypothetical protein